MKFTVFALFLVGLPTAVAAQQAPLSTLMKQQTPINGNEGVALSDQQVATYSLQALQGSGFAANQLGMHFLAARGNRKMSEYWYQISAENGDAGGQFSYASMMLEDSVENKARAKFWLEKSASQGDEYARRRLQRMAQ